MARDPIHTAMAFMLALFGVAVAAISRTGSRAVENAIRLRLRNEALVADLTAAQDGLVALNAGLEHRVAERTSELERMLKLRLESEAQLARFRVLINNPLAYILANLQHLATDIRESPSLSPGEKDALQEVVQDSLEGARRARCIVRDLGSLSPREKVELEPVDVCAVLQTCINVAMNENRHRAAFARELSVVRR